MNGRRAYLTILAIIFLSISMAPLSGCDVFRRSDFKRADKGEFTKPTRLPLEIDEVSVFK